MNKIVLLSFIIFSSYACVNDGKKENHTVLENLILRKDTLVLYKSNNPKQILDEYFYEYQVLGSSIKYTFYLSYNNEELILSDGTESYLDTLIKFSDNELKVVNSCRSLERITKRLGDCFYLEKEGNDSFKVKIFKPFSDTVITVFLSDTSFFISENIQ